MIYESTVDDVLFSTDKNKLNIPYIHQFLSQQSYWAKGIPMTLVQKSIQHSLTIGVFVNHKQIGFARVVSDYATFGYLADVFVEETYRGKGISKKLMEFILSIEEFKLLRRFILATADAHGLYEKFGFKALKLPHRFMEIHQPDVYKNLETVK